MYQYRKNGTQALRTNNETVPCVLDETQGTCEPYLIKLLADRKRIFEKRKEN